MDKFQNKYRIPSTRLVGYDYGSNGLYFVTICTKNKIHYFGDIVETDNYPSPNKTNITDTDNYLSLQNTNETDNYPSLQATEIGKIAREFWQQIPHHFPFVELDEFIIMPNHIHGVLFFNKPDKSDWNLNQFGSQSQNLPSVIRAYKSSVKRFANQNNIEFEWQNSYHDRIIRDHNEFANIREYIMNNPNKWATDDYYLTN